MENKIAVIGIIVENPDSVETLNQTLHNYSDIIIGRLGLPYKERSVNIISVAVDAPENRINELTEKIGGIDGVSSNAAVSN
ncbi:MAG: iron-only hydrogenase system regulator [Ruminococcus sp.]|nr:iron-only hydrogenase system regulator [Ruminococcus sp.]